MKSFIISSLVMAGFAEPTKDGLHEPNINSLDAQHQKFWNIFERQLSFSLAAHRSHGSHSSHGSHGSHRSSSSSAKPRTGGAVPNRNQNSTPPSAVLPSSPAISKPALRGNTDQFKRIAMRVQMYLYATGFYTGALDGVIGTDSKAAIMKYQKQMGLAITGTIDEALLKSMNVATD